MVGNSLPVINDSVSTVTRISGGISSFKVDASANESLSSSTKTGRCSAESLFICGDAADAGGSAAGSAKFRFNCDSKMNLE